MILQADRNKEWEDCLKQVALFDTVEDFWALYNHIQTASGLNWGSDYYLFKEVGLWFLFFFLSVHLFAKFALGQSESESLSKKLNPEPGRVDKNLTQASFCINRGHRFRNNSISGVCSYIRLC